MKRPIRSLPLILLCLLLSSPLWLLLAAPVIDDLALARFRAGVLRDIPPEAVVEVVSVCGNTSGTGDHTELYVAVLVHAEDPSQLPFFTQAVPQTQTMWLLDLSFSPENIGENSYIIEAYQSAPCSWFDIRGC